MTVLLATNNWNSKSLRILFGEASIFCGLEKLRGLFLGIVSMLLMLTPQLVNAGVSLMLSAQLANAGAQGLTDLLQEAVKNHPTVLGKQSEFQAAGYDLEGAKWSRYPSFSTELQTFSSGTSSLTKVEQPLWTGGRITSQIGIATAGVAKADASLSEIEQNVLQETANAFFDVLRLESRLKTALSNEAEHQKFTDSMARRVKSEISPVTDQTQTSTRLRQAITERIQIERQLSSARISLEQMVGKRVADLIKPNDINLNRWTEDSLLEASKQFSPERKRLLAQIESSEFEINLARSKIMPQLVAGYQVRLGTVPGTIGQDQMYLALQMQTGAGLSSMTSIQAAVSRKQAAADALDAQDRQLLQRLRLAWSERKALSEQLEPARGSLAASDTIVASYIRQFQVGKKNWLEVLNAQREKAQAYYAVADIESPLQLANIKLLILAGQITAQKITINDDNQ
jgi:adhesin transport system outer membrane protein